MNKTKTVSISPAAHANLVRLTGMLMIDKDQKVTRATAVEYAINQAIKLYGHTNQ